MVRIERLEATIVDVPTIRPHVLAMTTLYRQSLVLVSLWRSDGVMGLGEATTIGGLAYGAESPESIKLTLDAYIAPLLAGLDADAPAQAMALLDRHIVGNRFAKCAVETALLDGSAQALGVPLSRLLGGARRSHLPVAWTLASGDTARDIDEAEAMLAARRHRIFKLKIGKRAVADDCAHVGAIARALGDRARIRVDVNQHWSRHQALDGIARLADAGVELVEQPLAATDLEGMADLCARFPTAIMADEALTGPQSALASIRAGAARVLAVKIAQSGGLTAACTVAAIGATAHLGLYGGTMLEGGIGTIASAHACATFPSLEFGTELFGPLLLTEEILTEPLAYTDFGLDLPEGPGLGVRLDGACIARLARDNGQQVPDFSKGAAA